MSVFKRRIIREKVLQILYAYEMNHEGHKQTVLSLLEDVNDPSDKEFANELISKVIKHSSDFDKKIKERVANWEMNRIALVDKVLLRMGICEGDFFIGAAVREYFRRRHDHFNSGGVVPRVSDRAFRSAVYSDSVASHAICDVYQPYSGHDRFRALRPRVQRSKDGQAVLHRNAKRWLTRRVLPDLQTIAQTDLRTVH